MNWDLRHFSIATGINIDPPIPQVAGMKPCGFWVSDEAAEQSWSAWCNDEDFGDLAGKDAYTVMVNPDRLLVISTAEEIDAFNLRYRSIAGPPGYAIDWPWVAESHAGIIITPYLWSRRLDLMWYYGWDCASGCIWDMAAAEVTCTLHATSVP